MYGCLAAPIEEPAFRVLRKYVMSHGQRLMTMKRILIADDVRVIATVMSRTLTGAGYEIDVAQDGEECLEKIKSFRPHLIVLDLMMPKIHGIDVMRQLRSEPGGQDIGVIVFSSKSFSTEQRVAEELGAFAFIDKSKDSKQLLDTVFRFFSDERTSTLESDEPETEVFAPGLTESNGRFRLWGTRGSTPVTGSDYSHYGGNTSCMEIRLGDNLIVLDAGSGLRDLGNEIMANGPKKVHLLITHTHWDHIQGFPFFTPAYVPGYEVHIYAAKGFGKTLSLFFEDNSIAIIFQFRWKI